MPPESSIPHVWNGISLRCEYCKKTLPWSKSEDCPVRAAQANGDRKALPPATPKKSAEPKIVVIKPEIFMDHGEGFCQLNLTVGCGGQKTKLTRIVTDRNRRMLICPSCFVEVCKKAHLSFLYPRGLEPKK